MSYIIVWNPNSRDNFIHLDDHGFIEHFSDRDVAITEARECQDGEYYRDFILYEEDIFKIK
jgi:hypothetical protein